jgi:hypothetical protein
MDFILLINTECEKEIVIIYSLRREFTGFDDAALMD